MEAGVQQTVQHRRPGGVVALDVLWMLVILSLAVALSARGIGLVERRENAERLGRELGEVAAAVEKFAAAEGLEPGEEVAFADYGKYLGKGAPKRLREEGKDPLGHAYGTQRVGEPAVPDPATAAALGRFWN